MRSTPSTWILLKNSFRFVIAEFAKLDTNSRYQYTNDDTNYQMNLVMGEEIFRDCHKDNHGKIDEEFKEYLSCFSA
jgi:hypothetical protein